MNRDQQLEETRHYVRSLLEGEGTGHDWWHTLRVLETSIRIAEQEGADLFVVQLAALLHDVWDWKFQDGDDSIGPAQAREWLRQMQVEEEVISQVSEIIQGVSFKGAGVPTPMRTLEGMVVQDADRLDALGAIGIARAFAYGGYRGREIYNPEIDPKQHETFEQYKNCTHPTIHHFYEKLLLLKDRMNTATGKKIAENRHRFMENYLSQFFQEWEGKD